MKLKLTPLYVVSFVCLSFFIMELHEWAHTVVVALVSGSWGLRGFDRWDFPANISISNGQRALATLAGPLINIILIWLGWTKMANRDSLADQSIGCSLVLASMPFGLLLAAVTGGGDLTIGLKLLFSHTDVRHHHLMASIGLAIALLVCVPALVRIFMIMPSWQGRYIFFPIFVVAPVYVHRLFVHDLLNGLLTKSGVDDGLAYFCVLLWTAALLAGWLLTRRRMEMLLVDQELPL
jgi:hypothetical protein